VDSKAECGQLSLAHVAKNQQYKKKKLQQTNDSKSGPSPRFVKTVQAEKRKIKSETSDIHAFFTFMYIPFFCAAL